MLTKLHACITVYDPSGVSSKSSKSFDDGKYRPSEYNNDEAIYRFGYKVNAIETGDIKQHVETRVRNETRGAYFLIEPNGAGRFVQYIANSKGFNAVVRHQYGSKFARNLSRNHSMASTQTQQTSFNPNNFSEILNGNNTMMNQQQNITFNGFQDDRQIRINSKQNQKVRQSSPKPIINQNSAQDILRNSNENVQIMVNLPAAQPNRIIGRIRQYEVIDPEVEIDIRRSVPKPFLNLDKLKQPRKE